MAGAEEGSRWPCQLGLRSLPKAAPVNDRQRLGRASINARGTTFGAARTTSPKWAAVEVCLTFPPPVVVLFGIEEDVVTDRCAAQHAATGDGSRAARVLVKLV